MKYRAFIFISVLSLIAAVAAVNILPDEIPLHYDLAGNIDRVGSKFELFLCPAEIIVFSVLTILASRHFRKKADISSDEKTATHKANNARIVRIVGFVLCLYFFAFECFMIVDSCSGLSYITGSMTDLMCSIVCILAGILFAVIGNLMPKMKRNGIMGLRTTWSMKNDDVWERCQRTGGIMFFFAGVGAILTGLILRGMAALLTMTAILLGVLIASVICTKKIYEKWKKENG